MTALSVFKPRPWWWFPRSETLWSTWRWPFQVATAIYHPRKAIPVHHSHLGVIAHERIHVERQWSRWWGPLGVPLLYVLLPLPCLGYGRWWIERVAYLGDIKAGRYTVDEAVEAIWRGYLWPWPRWAMRRWFERELAK